MKYIKSILFAIVATVILSVLAFSADAPRIISDAEIRSEAPMGIRVKAALASRDAADENTTEYGFIVTRKVFLTGNGYGVYDLDFDCDVYYSKGIAKGIDNGESVDKFFDKTDTELYFAGHFYGIKPYYYTDTIVARPYIITAHGTFYGEPIETSVYSAAKRVFEDENAYSALFPEQQSVIREIVVAVEGEPYTFDSKDLRVVISSEVMKNKNPTYSVYYTLYNPYTGEVYHDVKGRKSSRNIAEIYDMLPKEHSMVPMYDGIVQDTTKEYIISEFSEGSMYWLCDCDIESWKMDVVPYNHALECKDCVAEYVTDTESQTLGVSRDTPVTVYDKDHGVFEFIDYEMSDICQKDKSLLCFNALSDNTIYSDYIKAYAYFDNDGVCEFIIVVVNDNEPSATEEKCSEHTLFDVTFMVDGVGVKSLKVPAGQIAASPDEPIKENYVFIGWSIDGENITYPESTPITQNTVYTAVFRGVMHKVSFYAGTKLHEEIEAEHGQNAVSPAIPERDKSTFIGWSKEVGGEIISLKNIEIVSDMVFYAKFESSLEDPKLISMLTEGQIQLEDTYINEGTLHDVARNLVVECISYILIDANSGIYVDTQYVYNAYPDMAEELRVVIKEKMTKRQRSNFVNLLSSNIEKEVREYIMSYFGISPEDLDI